MRYLTIILLLLLGNGLFAQSNDDQALALEYYQKQEYDKAAELYGKLYKKNPNSNIYYRYLYNSLLAIEDYEGLEKVLNKAIKKFTGELNYRVDLGNVYDKQGAFERAEKEYAIALDKLTADDRQINRLANAFITYGRTELAIKAFESGNRLFNNPYRFALQLAKMYENSGNSELTIKWYLDHLEVKPNDVQSIKNRLQEKLQEKAFYDLLEEALLAKIQRIPDMLTFSDLLIWQYIQVQDFESASIQAKAIDRRLNEGGARVLNIGRAALTERQFDAAIGSFQYVIDKGKLNSYYQMARQDMLNALKQKVTEGYGYTREDIDQLLASYNDYLMEFSSANTREVQFEKARLLAFYLNDFDQAIAELDDLLKSAARDRKFEAKCKIELGDYYLLKGEVWESTLLYSQVDKAMKDEPEGEMARFKNAKLSYYMGEFEWSQAQLNILKGSTSELIANDALELSVFIMDNFGLDTTLYPMQKYARADLLIYQNKLDTALLTLDSISDIFPGHSLADEILMTRANIYTKRNDFEKAAEYYEQIMQHHGEDLLGDDATFKLAQLYDYQFKDKKKALELYQKVILEYKGSVYVVEARKRFRKLRGDAL